ncbi:MAG: acyl-CoA dehydrogenase family protein, partial [Chloroflexi bacterium]|nr:acyl-CoA dehydrogenase family protein [Chloroflexota bacterium]
MARTVDQLHHATAGDAEDALEAIVALQPVIRDFQEETERGVRIPAPLVERLRAVGLYRMAVPRLLGGLQLDLLVLLQIVELAAEADGSVGWNLINNSTNQLAALGLPDEGVAEVFGARPDPIIGGTVVPGGGR